MADPIKRISMSRTKTFQDRCMYYMYEQAGVVFAQETPDPNDLLLAKAVWAGQVKAEDMARVTMTNTTIGPAIDAGNAVEDGWIEYAIKTENKFHDLAEAYSAAGLIGA